MLKGSFKKNIIEAGCDEAGRGCLAGPVVAAAVIFSSGYRNSLLDDSKKLSAVKREQLQNEIKLNAMAWAIGQADNNEIDKLNILTASILAMQRAISQLNLKPEHIIIDGNHFSPFQNISHTCIVRGDNLYLSIAAASILAKTYRDAIMLEMHKKFPVYGWDKNKGYPTSRHVKALENYGASPLHRKSFRLKPHQTRMQFGS